ncbi:MAG: DUF4230 domain-containing protein [Sphaerochaetaceae bacterium]|nr:DUF4230 domain-containing protein [Sphaerochaetaceae bacterium]
MKKSKKGSMFTLASYVAAAVILFMVSEIVPDRGIDRVSAYAQQTNEELEALALETCRGFSVYDIAEVQISILKSIKRGIIRTLLPDGWVEAWLRCLGNIRAGVNLSMLTSNDLQISTDAEGNRHATLYLPAPEITSTVLNDEEWGSSHNFWVWAPDRMAIEIRQQLRQEAYSELEERALESGLLEQARSLVAEKATEILSAFNIPVVDVILEDDRVLELGIAAGERESDD